MDNRREIYQVADKNNRDSSVSKAKHLVAFDMAEIRACVHAMRGKNKLNGRRKTERRNAPQQLANRWLLNARIRCSGASVEDVVHMHQVV